MIQHSPAYAVSYLVAIVKPEKSFWFCLMSNEGEGKDSCIPDMIVGTRVSHAAWPKSSKSGHT